MDEQTMEGPGVRPRVLIQVHLQVADAIGLRQLSKRLDTPQSVLVRQAISRVLREEGLLQENGL